MVTSPIAVFTDPEQDGHDTPPWHPEHKGRLDASLAGIHEAGLDDATEWRIPELASVDDLSLVHERDYVDAIEAFCAAGWRQARRRHLGDAGLVGDRPPQRRRRARRDQRAAGTGSATSPSPPAVRPVTTPCRTGRWASACSTTLRWALPSSRRRVSEVAIVDWDVHHGNGTQDIFYDDPNVLYVSTHESPLYPGTGHLRETASGDGYGANVNLPFPAGTAGDTFRVRPSTRSSSRWSSGSRPTWLIISAGFDGHRDDPLAGLGLTSADYADMALRLQSAGRGPAPPGGAGGRLRPRGPHVQHGGDAERADRWFVPTRAGHQR